MGRRIRPLLFAAERAKRGAELVARKEAIRIIDAWNKRLLGGTRPLFSPTIRAALLGGCRWLDVYCPGCKTVAAVDLEKIDRHPDASLGSFVWWLKCRNCRGLPVPFPKLLRVWGNDWLRERLWLTAEK